MAQQNLPAPETLIPPQPVPECAQQFTDRVQGLLDGRQKDDATVAKAFEGMDAPSFDQMIDMIAAGLYTMASMLVGEGEQSVGLVETAIANADVAACEDASVARQSSISLPAATQTASRLPRACSTSPPALKTTTSTRWAILWASRATTSSACSPVQTGNGLRPGSPASPPPCGRSSSCARSQASLPPKPRIPRRPRRRWLDTRSRSRTLPAGALLPGLPNDS